MSACEIARRLIDAEFSRNRAAARHRGTRQPSSRSFRTRISCDEGKPRGLRGLVPGAGFEPAFLGPEPSVLPARRSRIDGGSGGIRTLAVSGKSRVRFQLRYGPARGTRGTRTLISRVKSPVPSHWASVPQRCVAVLRFIVVFPPERTEGRPERPRGGLRGSIENARKCLRIAIRPDTLSRFDLWAHLS